LEGVNVGVGARGIDEEASVKMALNLYNIMIINNNILFE
jgi:hypothetical protein